MNNRILAIILIIGVVGIVYIFVLFNKPTSENIPALHAVPLSSGVVFKVNGLLPALVSLENNNSVNVFKRTTLVRQLIKIHNSLDSISAENPLLTDILADSSIYIAMNIADQNTSVSITIPYDSRIKPEKIKPIAESALASFGFNFKMYEPQTRKLQKNGWYYFVNQGIIELCNNFEMASESFHQLKRNVTLMSDTSFASVFATSGKNVVANVYVNTGKTSKLLELLFKRTYIQTLAPMLGASGWLALDANIDAKYMSFQGFSLSNSENNFWLKQLKSEQPVDCSVLEIIPDGTAFYSVFATTDPFGTGVAYKNQLKSDKNLVRRLKKMQKAFGFNIDEKIAEIADDAVGQIYWYHENVFEKICFIKTTGTAEALDFVTFVSKNQPSRKNLKLHNNPDTTSTRCIKTPVTDLPSVLYGNSFDGANNPYLCNYKAYLFWGSSESVLLAFTNKLIHHQLLVNDSAFSNITNGLLTTKTNLSLVLNFSVLWQYCKANVVERISASALQQQFDPDELPFIGMQIAGNGKFNYNSYVVYSEKKTSRAPTNIQWQTSLDAPPVKIFGLHSDNAPSDNALLCQDEDNTLYLLNTLGKIRWKYQLESPVLGHPASIDFFRNGITQIVFNTADALFMIDKAGNDVPGFPVRFKNKATSGIAVGDFDKNRNYRFYLAFDNGTFVALTKEGRKVGGWNFENTTKPVYDKALCFSFKGKDYIVFHDATKIFILNRKGERVFEPDKDFQIGAASNLSVDFRKDYFRLITTDTAANIKALYPDGHIETLAATNLGSDHYFTAADMDGDNEAEYILASNSQLQTYNSKGALLFRTLVPGKISAPPLIAKFSKSDTRILVSSNDLSTIYMLNSAGEINASTINGFSPINFISLSENIITRGVICRTDNKIVYYNIDE